MSRLVIFLLLLLGLSALAVPNPLSDASTIAAENGESSNTTR
jgi:hypothetical protein